MQEEKNLKIFKLHFSQILETSLESINVNNLKNLPYTELKKWISLLSNESKKEIQTKAGVKYWYSVIRNLQGKTKTENPFLWQSFTWEIRKEFVRKKMQYPDKEVTAQEAQSVLG